MKFGTRKHDTKLKCENKNQTAIMQGYIGNIYQTAIMQGYIGNIYMQDGQKIKELITILPNQINFGTRIHNNKIQNRIKNHPGIMQRYICNICRMVSITDFLLTE